MEQRSEEYKKSKKRMEEDEEMETTGEERPVPEEWLKGIGVQSRLKKKPIEEEEEDENASDVDVDKLLESEKKII